MKKVLLFDPAIGSINLGDHIISAAAREALQPLLQDSFVIDMSTHTPIGIFYQKHFMQDIDLKFVLGSNLLMGKLNGRFRQWDINLISAKYIAPVILLGVGWWQVEQNWNHYTRRLYRRVLAGDYYHSVRDEMTKDRLNAMGFKNVINTGCPTTWSLTEAHCRDIPRSPASAVVWTVTDYMPDLERDRFIFKVLKDVYDIIYLWLQGSGDVNYAKNICGDDFQSLQLISPSLAAFDNFLSSHDTDYIGTRLHAGIRALQHRRRSLIIGIDHRAVEMKRDINLPVLEHNELVDLPTYINRDIQPFIKIPTAEIDRFLQQIF